MNTLIQPAVVLLLLLQLTVPVLAQEARTPAEAVAFFESRIRPVLVEHCYQCHSADSKPLQGGLLLDTAEGVRRGGDSGAAVVTGDPQNSRLLKALRYEDDVQMPPDGRLSEQVVRDFESWIRDGAADPREGVSGVPAAATPAAPDIAAGRQLWAFQVPSRSEWLDGQATGGSSAAAVTDSARIDQLVERVLHEHSLQANPAADRRTLIRRVTFDLTGLPPTPEEVAAFVADEHPQAFVRVVDRLLDVPAYGERWARVWLDVARYAEDQAHIVGDNKELFYPNAWRYRDWVIAALNDDVPYDRFLQLQLAADLIVPEDRSAQPALGFIGLGPKYYRRNDPEVMAEEWEDRVDLIGRGLQGLTVACARCHHHKYDPIPTEDYYALAGIFAGTEMFNQPLEGQPAKSGEKKSAEKKSGDKKADPGETLHVVRDSQPRDLAVMIRGNVHNRGPVVPRGFLQVVSSSTVTGFQAGSGRRALAEAITSPQNPLTARVIVNRIWQQYFGRGLVATASNFGALGERPTHPELLDDLSARLMQNGWSLKWLHRQIVLSQTYQRSSDVTLASQSTDPGNQWLWRMPRRRLSVEAWRDAVLAVSGRLDRTVGGPSIPPDDPEQVRRTVYAEVSRFQLNALLARFDFPDPNAHAERRVETNTPLQKLFLLNSPFMLAQAEHLATRLAAVSSDADQRLSMAFQMTLQRDPDDEEQRAATEFLQKRGEDGWQQLAQSLMASNEFWYLD